MNNVFNFQRFGKYLTYDLNNARYSYGLSLLIIALLPAIIFFFTQLFSLIFTFQFTEYDSTISVAGLAIGTIILQLSAPTKMYGALTEKKQGSDWLMIPASSFEKFLSMVVILCVVLPVLFIVGFSCCDLIMSLVPGYNGSFTKDGYDAIAGFFQGMNSYSEFVTISKGAIFGQFWANWTFGILVFALGAVIFKKRKVARTILCYFLFSIILMCLIVAFFGPEGTRLEALIESIDVENVSPQRVQFWFNFITNALNIIGIGGIGTALFFRIKTMKH